MYSSIFIKIVLESSHNISNIHYIPSGFSHGVYKLQQKIIWKVSYFEGFYAAGVETTVFCKKVEHDGGLESINVWRKSPQQTKSSIFWPEQGAEEK